MKKKVLIIYNKDGLANSERALQTQLILKKNNFKVVLLNAVLHLNRFYQKQGEETLWSWLRYHFRFLEPVGFFWPPYIFAKRFPLYFQFKERGKLISTTSDFISSDIVICQSPYEIASLLFLTKKQVSICDMPTSISEELKYSDKRISLTEFIKIMKLERKIYYQTNILTFHWSSVQKYVIKKFDLKSKNIISSGWGAKKHLKKALFSSQPRIVFLGNLDDYWVNKPLLLKLIKKSKFQIDLYGKTEDEKIKKLSNYKGYLPERELNKLAKYQFGLITITDDKLRRRSFSAKHLFYYSYGLPVLSPEWRKDQALSSANISYNINNFNQVVSGYISQRRWQEKSRAALKIAGKFTWDQVFKEMIDVLLKK